MKRGHYQPSARRVTLAPTQGAARRIPDIKVAAESGPSGGSPTPAGHQQEPTPTAQSQPQRQSENEGSDSDSSSEGSGNDSASEGFDNRSLHRIGTDENEADIGTKYLDAERLTKLLDLMGLRRIRGPVAALALVAAAPGAAAAAAPTEVEGRGFVVVWPWWLGLSHLLFLLLGVVLAWVARGRRGEEAPLDDRAGEEAHLGDKACESPPGASGAPEDRVVLRRRLRSTAAAKAVVDARVALLRAQTVDTLRDILRVQRLPRTGLKQDLLDSALGGGGALDVICAESCERLIVESARRGRAPPLGAFLAEEAAQAWSRGA